MDVAEVRSRTLSPKTSRIALLLIVLALGILFYFLSRSANQLRIPVMESTVEEYLKLMREDRILKVWVGTDVFKAEFRGEIQRNGVFYKRLRFDLPKEYRDPPQAVLKLILLLPPEQVVWER